MGLRGERIATTRRTFGEVADEWIAAQGHLRPRTLDAYRWAIEKHLRPALGTLRIAEIDEQAIIEDVIAPMQARKLKAWTIRGALTPLGRILTFAVRRGEIPSNPLSRLDRGERPSVGRKELAVLDSDEISRVIAHAGEWRPLLATLVFTGLRIGEARGLQWHDVNLDAGLITVARQVGRDRQPAALKTSAATRDVVIMDALARVLRAHRLASPYPAASDPVFASAIGTPIDDHNARSRGLRPALRAAGVERNITLHDLRHTAASLMIANGADVVFVSHQLGHASPAITLTTYARIFDQVAHAATMRDRMQTRYGALLDTKPATPATITPSASPNSA